MPIRSRRKKRNPIVLVLLFLAVLIFGTLLVKGIGYLPVFYQLLFNKKIELKTATGQPAEDNAPINVLLLGIGGGTHEGPDLTDTIIVAHIDPKANKVSLITIPRDLWVPEVKAKINSVYADGEEKGKGKGLILTKAMISKVIGQPIDYGFRIDFGGFVKAVDMVGGLDINVDRTFDDYAYPITGKEDDTCGYSSDEIASMSAQIASGSASDTDLFPCRYEHLHFDKGLTHMDGETALKYVRSRHALGVEGTDFARSRRQQKVISAFKQKIFSAQTFLNPIKLVSLYDIFKDSIDTDIQQSEYDDFVKLAQRMKGATIKNYSIDMGDETTGREGLLINPPISEEYGNAWVLSPKAGNGDYDEIHDYVTCVEGPEGDSCGIPPTPTPTATTASVKTKTSE